MKPGAMYRPSASIVAPGRLGAVEPADRPDPVAGDRHVGPERGTARAVDHPAALDEQVEIHGPLAPDCSGRAGLFAAEPVRSPPQVPHGHRPVRSPGLGQRDATGGVGRSVRPWRSVEAARTPGLPSGSMSGRFRAKIRNISAVQTPTPLIAVIRSTIASSFQPLDATQGEATFASRLRQIQDVSGLDPREADRAEALFSQGQQGRLVDLTGDRRSLASIVAAALAEICWPMIARTSVPKRSGLKASRHGPTWAIRRAHRSLTPRMWATASAHGSSTAFVFFNHGFGIDGPAWANSSPGGIGPARFYQPRPVASRIGDAGRGVHRSSEIDPGGLGRTD